MDLRKRRTGFGRVDERGRSLRIPRLEVRVGLQQRPHHLHVPLLPARELCASNAEHQRCRPVHRAPSVDLHRPVDQARVVLQRAGTDQLLDHLVMAALRRD